MWETKAISLSTIEGPFPVIAKCRGDLVVHPMVKDEGFCISLASTGLRMSWRHSVFKSEEGAIRIADAMLATGIDWGDFFAEPMPESVRYSFCRIHEVAERDDLFIPGIAVFSAPPSDCIVH